MHGPDGVGVRRRPGGGPERLDGRDFLRRGDVEGAALRREHRQDARVRVALDRKVRNDAAQVLLPAEVLAVDVSEVRDEEGVLVASLAVVGVHGLHMLLQGSSDQFFGKLGAILSVLFIDSLQRGLVEVIGLSMPRRIVRAEVEGDRCHNLCGWCVYDFLCRVLL